jgi:hypothetical protein
VFPFGTSDLSQRLGHPIDRASFRNEPFLAGVGADDNNPADVPHTWDRYEGTTRVERARAFVESVRAAGGHADLSVFQQTRHEFTSEMQAGAYAFLRALDTEDQRPPVPATEALVPIFLTSAL